MVNDIHMTEFRAEGIWLRVLALHNVEHGIRLDHITQWTVHYEDRANLQSDDVMRLFMLDGSTVQIRAAKPPTADVRELIDVLTAVTETGMWVYDPVTVEIVDDG